MIEYKIKRKSETREWIVREYINGKLNASADYFTDDKQDAIDTKKSLDASIPKVEVILALKEYLINLSPKNKDIIWEYLDGNADAIYELIECVATKNGESNE